MSSVNARRTSFDTALTHAGGQARKMTNTQALQRAVNACLLWEDTFYESGESIADRLTTLTHAVPIDVALAVAERAHREMFIRHAPLQIAVAVLSHPDRQRLGLVNGPSISDEIASLLTRPDQLTELVSLYWKGKRKPLPNQLKKALASAFTLFEAYQLGKYKQEGKELTLRDVMFLAHPKPRDAEQAEVFKQFADGTLAPPNTWEVRLSASKSDAEKRAIWTDLIETKQLGDFAFLRNLRNMVKVGVDSKLIRQSFGQRQFKKILPFRFLAAIDIPEAGQFAKEIEGAMLAAARSFPRLEGRTAVLVDTSGSMMSPVSGKSAILRVDAAAGLGVLAQEISESADVFAFATNVAQVKPAYRGLGLREALTKGNGALGHGTETESALRAVRNKGYNRIIVITDEQSAQKVGGPGDAKGYMINVAPYKNGVGYGPWVHIDGFSENTLRFIAEHENAGDIDG